MFVELVSILARICYVSFSGSIVSTPFYSVRDAAAPTLPRSRLQTSTLRDLLFQLSASIWLFWFHRSRPSLVQPSYDLGNNETLEHSSDDFGGNFCRGISDWSCKSWKPKKSPGKLLRSFREISMNANISAVRSFTTANITLPIRVTSRWPSKIVYISINFLACRERLRLISQWPYNLLFLLSVQPG